MSKFTRLNLRYAYHSTAWLLTVFLLLSWPPNLRSQTAQERPPRVHEPVSPEALKIAVKKKRQQIQVRYRVASMNGPLVDVIAHIAKATGVRMNLVREIDGQELVHFRGGKRTPDGHLKNIGMKRFYGLIQKLTPGSFVGQNRGIWFYAESYDWQRDGAGTVFRFRQTSAVDTTSPLVDWSASFSAKGKPIAFESCQHHSPERLLVRKSSGQTDKIKVKGDHWWYTEHNFTLKDFNDGDAIQIGEHKFVMEWPHLKLINPMAYPSALLPYPFFFHAKLKPGKKKHSGGGIGLGGGASGRFGRQKGNFDWCGCKNKCTEGKPQPLKQVEAGQELRYSLPEGLGGNLITDFSEFRFCLRIPTKTRISITMKPAK